MPTEAPPASVVGAGLTGSLVPRRRCPRSGWFMRRNSLLSKAAVAELPCAPAAVGRPMAVHHPGCACRAKRISDGSGCQRSARSAPSGSSKLRPQPTIRRPSWLTAAASASPAGAWARFEPSLTRSLAGSLRAERGENGHVVRHLRACQRFAVPSLTKRGIARRGPAQRLATRRLCIPRLCRRRGAHAGTI